MKKYLLLLLIPTLALAAGRLQNSDFMTEGELTGAGGTAAQLLNDSKIYVTGNALNKTLDDAIADGDIGTPLSAKGNLVGFGTATEECVLDKTDGKLLTVDSTATCGFDFKDAPIALPDQTGENGNILFTNGTDAEWKDVDDLSNIAKDNLLECGGFEQCPTGSGASAWVAVNDSMLPGKGTSTRAIEAAANNNTVLTFSGINIPASDFSVSATLTETTGDFEGKQMVARCEVRTDRPDVTFSSMVDGVVESSLNVIGDDKWRYYDIPLVGGATSVGMKVDGSTTPDQGYIKIDNCFLGKNVLTKELGQAHFVGKIDLSNDCLYRRTTAGHGKLLDTDSTCSATSIVGNISLPTNTNEGGFKVLNKRTDGYYKFNYYGLVYKTGAGYCEFSTSKDGALTDNGEYYTGSANETANSDISGSVKFEDGDTGEIFFTANANGGATCSVYGNTSDTATITVHFYPDANSTVVTQDTELTTETANEFSAKLLSQGAIQSQNYDWIQSISKDGNHLYTITFKSGLFTQLPSCGVEPRYRQHVFEKNIGVNSMTVVMKAVDAGFSSPQVQGDFDLHCSKQGADLNKSATIVGKFEQVESVMADLTAETANRLTFTGNYVGGTTTHTMVDDVYGVVDSVSPQSSSGWRVFFPAGLFTSIPKVECESHDSSGSLGEFLVYSVTTGGFYTQAYNQTGAVHTYNGSYDCTVTKSGADYNKNISGAIINASNMQQEIADIVIENTASDDLVVVRATTDNAQSFANNVAANIIYDDVEAGTNTGGWYNSSTGVFTAPKKSNYLMCAGIMFNTASWAVGTRYFMIGAPSVHTDYYMTRQEIVASNTDYYQDSSCYIAELNEGETFGFLLGQNSGGARALFTSAQYNRMSIQELPDTASIIKNLNDNNTTKCQTKYLSADVSANGPLADLAFSNLDTSKYYSLTVATSLVYSVGNVCRVYVSDGTKILINERNREADAPEDRTSNTSSNPFFKPLSSTLTTSFVEGNTCILEGNGDYETWAKLCELPDSHVETTEF